MTEIDLTHFERTSANEVLGNFHLQDEIEITIFSKSHQTLTFLDKVKIPVLCLDRNRPSPLTIIDEGVEIDILFNILEDSHLTDELLFQSFDSKLSSEACSLSDAYPWDRDGLASPESGLVEERRTLQVKRRVWRLHSEQIYSGLKAFLSQLSSSEVLLAAVDLISTLCDFLQATNRFVVMVVLDLTHEFFRQVDSLLLSFLRKLDLTVNRLIDESLEVFLISVDKLQKNLWGQLQGTAALMDFHRGLLLGQTKRLVKYAVWKANPVLHSVIDRAEPLFELGQPLVLRLQQPTIRICRYLETHPFSASLYRSLRCLGEEIVRTAVDTYEKGQQD